MASLDDVVEIEAKMSTFRAPVLPVDSVDDHPEGERLSVLSIRGYESIVARNKDGSHAYRGGDRVLYVPVGGVLPEAMLRANGLWKAKEGVGRLFGERGDRVSAIELRGRLSMGLALPVPGEAAGLPDGTCLAEMLGITKYIPPVPPSLMGQVAVRMEAKMPYVIEHLLAYPELLAGDVVVVTEKMHGVNSQVSYVPGLGDPLMFGAGDVTIASKGLADQGLVFTSAAENALSPYVTTALSAGLPETLRRWGDTHAPGRVVTMVAEVFGRGIQDLSYGSAEPALRAIDLRVGGTWADDEAKAAAFKDLQVPRVPVLYRGRFDRAILDELHVGMSTFPGAANIKEGIVVNAVGSQASRRTDLQTFIRPILKYHSPAYDLRPDGTEHG